MGRRGRYPARTKPPGLNPAEAERELATMGAVLETLNRLRSERRSPQGTAYEAIGSPSGHRKASAKETTPQEMITPTDGALAASPSDAGNPVDNRNQRA